MADDGLRKRRTGTGKIPDPGADFPKVEIVETVDPNNSFSPPFSGIDTFWYARSVMPRYVGTVLFIGFLAAELQVFSPSSQAGVLPVPADRRGAGDSPSLTFSLHGAWYLGAPLAAYVVQHGSKNILLWLPLAFFYISSGAYGVFLGNATTYVDRCIDFGDPSRFQYPFKDDITCISPHAWSLFLQALTIAFFPTRASYYIQMTAVAGTARMLAMDLLRVAPSDSVMTITYLAAVAVAAMACVPRPAGRALHHSLGLAAIVLRLAVILTSSPSIAAFAELGFVLGVFDDAFWRSLISPATWESLSDSFKNNPDANAFDNATPYTVGGAMAFCLATSLFYQLVVTYPSYLFFGYAW